jgi:hypothetical protein
MKYISGKFKFLLFLFVICFNIQQGVSQSDSVVWLAENCNFPLLEYDLLEVQPYVGLFILNGEDTVSEGAYIPVNIAFRKSIIQWSMLNMQFDLSFGVAAYTQFEIIRYDENTLRGGLLNIDYKASGFLSFVKTQNKFRFQMFHISSHLGDDYIYRNEVFDLNNKSVNYEQIDFVYLRSLKKISLYGGLGYVFSPNSFRERFMAQLGFQGNLPSKGKWNLAFGTDIKFYDENEFVPDIHSAIGMTFNQKGKPQINFSLDGYFGHMPYSTLDFGKVYWLGLSSRLHL